MSAPNVLPFGPRDSAVDRQEIVDALHRMLDSRQHLAGFADNFKLAVRWRVWEQDRVFAGGTRQGPITFDAFVREPYPVGLGATDEIVTNLIRNDPEAVLAWDEVKRRGAGGNNNPEGLGGRSGKNADPGIVNVDNIHVDKEERPSGTSTEAGLRKLQKAASEGNEIAAAQLAEVMAGHKKVHTACVNAGLRKPTKIDADVRARCSRSVAEWIVERLGQDDPSPIVSDLFALGGGAKHIAAEIKNLVGEFSVMDRRYG